ncbi:MAG: glycosyltransferase family 39 protein [Candidatus Daviesbacteria bacterium]|nr:glycosyltransferase family 39 protein [Candidatus Daviesbacteria bacterium]
MNKFTFFSLKNFATFLSKSKILLILIIMLAAAVRVVALDKFPNGFTGDEAQQGYSAYSILKTGQDEWGQFLPLNPRGFGDFKPPFYTYLTIPAVAIFDLNITAVRLPAALIGILTVLIVYFLTKELLSREDTALWAAFLLSISPWHIQLSRTAFEGGVGILTFSLGLLFFLKSKEKKYLILTIILWGLTFYTYHSFRVLIVLFVLGLFFLCRLSKKQIVYLGLGLFIFLIPLLINFGNISARASDVGIFSNEQITGYFKYKGTSPLSPGIDKIFDNKFLFIKNNFQENYLSYFSSTFFFTGARPDNTYLNFPGFGLLYVVEIIFWLFAIKEIFFKKLINKEIIIWWFLIAPVGAALATGGLNANRAPTFLPLTAIISAIGIVSLVDFLRNKFANLPWVRILTAILLVYFIFFLYFYFIKLSQHPINNVRFGYETIFEKVLSVKTQYSQIVISSRLTEPQIFVAFYGKIDPQFFQTSSTDWLRYERSNKLYVDQLESWNLDNFYFEGIDWLKKDSLRKNALIVSEPEDFPEDIKSLLDVKNPAGKIIYRIVPTK